VLNPSFFSTRVGRNRYTGAKFKTAANVFGQWPMLTTTFQGRFSPLVPGSRAWIVRGRSEFTADKTARAPILTFARQQHLDLGDSDAS
jgi:hypothetical protein